MTTIKVRCAFEQHYFIARSNCGSWQEVATVDEMGDCLLKGLFLQWLSSEIDLLADDQRRPYAIVLYRDDSINLAAIECQHRGNTQAVVFSGYNALPNSNHEDANRDNKRCELNWIEGSGNGHFVRANV